MPGSGEVLIVEDNTGDAKLLREGLKACAAVVPHVLCAVRGADAIEMLSRDDYRPDLLIVDLHLPDIDGHEVIRHARRPGAATARTPIIVLSGSDAYFDRSSAGEESVDAYLVKPREFADYMEAVRGICRGWLDPLLKA